MRLLAEGVVFSSDTDSDVFVHLIAAMPDGPLDAAVRAALRLVVRTYGLGVLDAAQPEALVVARAKVAWPERAWARAKHLRGGAGIGAPR